jgi:DNA-directed RNA polymerase subunit beta
VKDSSLRVPPGVEGIVIDTKVFSRRGVEKDQRSLSIEREEKARLEKDKKDQVQIIERSARGKLREILLDKKLKTNLRDKKAGKLLCSTRKVIGEEEIAKIPVEAWAGADVKASMDEIERMEEIVQRYTHRVSQIKSHFDERQERLSQGDELAPGVIKMVKVYVAVKRKLAVGDKMAGRHGNKGVLSRILPVEDMPYFSDGTPVDVVLNPLGVPSRMNVGQVLEAHLGWASRQLGRQVAELLDSLKDVGSLRKKLADIFSPEEYKDIFKDMDDAQILTKAGMMKEGVHMASPVFDGAKEEEIKKCLAKAGLPVTGQAVLYDGRTGLPFDQQVTVGMLYVMKLHHLVDDKLHARSIGPYSLVTQQPLGGKAQFGGQRLGEMEVWAMEAYGAAYSLQEFLTVKSDDVAGRTRMYERIVKGNNILEAGLPESFKVLLKELLALGLDVQLFEDTQE